MENIIDHELKKTDADSEAVTRILTVLTPTALSDGLPNGLQQVHKRITYIFNMDKKPGYKGYIHSELTKFRRK